MNRVLIITTGSKLDDPLIKYFLSKCLTITVVVHKDTNSGIMLGITAENQHPDVVYIKADITDRAVMNGIFTQKKPTILIHTTNCHLNTSQDESTQKRCIEINQGLNVIDCAVLYQNTLQHNFYCLLVSTTDVLNYFDGQQDENTVSDLAYLYAKSKDDTQQYCRTSGLNLGVVYLNNYPASIELNNGVKLLYALSNLTQRGYFTIETERGMNLQEITDLLKTPGPTQADMSAYCPFIISQAFVQTTINRTLYRFFNSDLIESYGNDKPAPFMEDELVDLILNESHYQPYAEGVLPRPLLIACSGGGGHITAIQAFTTLFDQECLALYSPEPYVDNLKSFMSSVMLFASHLNGSSYIKNMVHNLGLPGMPELPKVLDAIEPLKSMQKQKRPYRDMLLDAYPVGYICVAIWNVLQREDQKEELAKLIAMQPYNDSLYYKQVHDYFFNMLKTARLIGQPYTEIVSTQAIGIPALCDAVARYNQRYNESIIIHQYMTDLPTKGAVHFFNVLSKLSPNQQKLIRLYAVGMNNPVLEHFFSHGQNFQGIYSIDAKQNPMIRRGFSDPNNDNSKNFNSFITLNPKNHVEVLIEPGDKIASIMLGSQASTDSVHYIEPLINNQINRVFIFCGSNTQIQKHVDQLEPQLKNKIHLLGNQDDAFIAALMSRSNIVIIRAGGLSVMEQLAMNHHQNQIILMHHAQQHAIEVTGKVYSLNPKSSTRWNAINAVLAKLDLNVDHLISGISWEDCNADMLIQLLREKKTIILKSSPTCAQEQISLIHGVLRTFDLSMKNAVQIEEMDEDNTLQEGCRLS